jgi:hypothetical protein
VTLALRNPCACGLLVCGACRAAHEDTCTYDYRAAERRRLTATMQVVVFPKVSQI